MRKIKIGHLGTKHDHSWGIFAPLKKCNVYMISQGASFVNISFVVDREELSEVVQDLHDHLFDNPEELADF